MKIHKALKHAFIPHEGNDYKPHILREFSVAFFLFVSVFLLGASFGSSLFLHKTVLGVEIASSVLVDLTNESRLAFNEQPLVRNQVLDRAAQLKGEDMARTGYFAHNSPTGVTPWHWFKVAGYPFIYAGENLAIDFTDSTEVEKAWLESPTHRANLLNVKFREIGIATVEGLYEGNPTIFVVQMFGTPAKASVGTVAISDSKLSVGTTSSDGVEKKAVVGAVTSVGTSTGAVGEVKGDTSSGAVEQNLISVVDTEKTAVVKDGNAEEAVVGGSVGSGMVVEAPASYSTWYQRIMFSGPRYVDGIYKGLILLFAFALVTMILVEIRKQHYRHITYGVVLLTVLVLFVMINKSFF
jgi:hypothetical protein